MVQLGVHFFQAPENPFQLDVAVFSDLGQENVLQFSEPIRVGPEDLDQVGDVVYACHGPQFPGSPPLSYQFFVAGGLLPPFLAGLEPGTFP